MADKPQAKITITAKEEGVKSTLKAVEDLEKRLKALESQLKSYDTATTRAAIAQERLKKMTYDNMSAIDPLLKKQQATVKAQNDIASASVNLGLKTERLTKAKYANATALDVESAKYLKESNAINDAAIRESRATTEKEKASKAIYDRNVRLEESVAKYLKESDAINASVVKENQAIASKQRVIVAQNQAAASANKVTISQQQVQAATFRTVVANNQAQISAVKLGTAQNQQSVSANRVTISENQAAASAERLKVAQNQAEMSAMRLKKMQDGVSQSVEHSHKSWLAHIATVASGIIVYQGIRTAMHGVLALISGGVKAVSDYQDAMIGMASMYTTLAKDQSDIGATYQKNKQYVESLIPVLQEIDKYSAMNLDELLQMNQALAREGIALNTNNKEQIQGYTNISNAILFLTKGQATSRQIAQEIRAVMEGQLRPSDALSKLLASKIGPEYKKHIADWKKIGEAQKDSGYILSQIGKYLTGYTAAAEDMKSSWTAVTSSIGTTFQILARESMTEVLKDWVKYLDKFNEYLRDHKKEISDAVKNVWQKMKDIAIGIYENWDKVKSVLLWLIGFEVTKGVLNLVVGFLEFQKAVVATQTAVEGLRGAILLTELIASPMVGIIAGIAASVALLAYWIGKSDEAAQKAYENNKNRQITVNGKTYGSTNQPQTTNNRFKQAFYNASFVKVDMSQYNQPDPLAAMPETMTGNTGGGDNSGKASHSIETRAKMLLKWKNEADKVIKTQYMTNEQLDVEGKLISYNDELSQKRVANGNKGYEALTKAEEEYLRTALKQGIVAKEVQKQYENARQPLVSLTLAQEAYDNLVKNDSKYTEEYLRNLNKAKDAYEKSINPIHDYVEGLQKQNELVGLYGHALEIATARQEISDKLKQEGIVAGMESYDTYMKEAIAAKKLAIVMKEQPHLWEDMKQASLEWSDTFSSTLSDMLWNAEFSFSKILESYGKMLFDMVIKTQVVQPMFNSLFNSFGGGGISYSNNGGAQAVDLSAYFANGGIMTASGPMPLRAYATGGVATGPQLALYGEGSMNEAYVPLPDGRSIPVTMNQASQNITVELINKSGSELQSTTTSTRQDASGMIVSVVIDAVQRNKMGLRDIITQR